MNSKLPTHDGDHDQLVNAFTAQCLGAFVDGRTGGEHIIDEYRALGLFFDQIFSSFGYFE